MGRGEGFFLQNKDVCFILSKYFIQLKIPSVFCFQGGNERPGSSLVCNSGEGLPGSWEMCVSARLCLKDRKPPSTQLNVPSSRPFLCGFL